MVELGKSWFGLRMHLKRGRSGSYVCLLILLLMQSRNEVLGGTIINSLDDVYRIDFEKFRGGGLSPNPSDQQLDSNLWSIQGVSDGSALFGGTYVTGDFARGSAVGSVTTGGIYAFDVGMPSNPNWSLGFQPTARDFSPGGATLRLINNTGQLVDMVQVGFGMLSRNNGDRSSRVKFGFSTNDLSYHFLDRVSVTSPELRVENAGWFLQRQQILIDQIGLAADGALYLRWQIENESGSGSRDEWAIDDVTLQYQMNQYSVPEPNTLLLMTFGALLQSLLPFIQRVAVSR